MKYIIILIAVLSVSACAVPKKYTIQDCESLDTHSIAQCKFETMGEYINGSSSVSFTVEDCDKMGVEDKATVLSCKRVISNLTMVRQQVMASQAAEGARNAQQFQTLYNINNLLMRY